MNTENKIQIDDYVLNYSYHKKDPHKPPRGDSAEESSQKGFNMELLHNYSLPRVAAV